MKIPLVDLAAQYQTIKPEIDDAIQRVLQRSSFILGEEVESFETEFAAYCGSSYCIGVASGSAALHLALLASGIGPGDEVITTPFTFAATAEAIVHCGAKPVFVDVRGDDANIDPAKIEQAITPRTKAIVPVHLYGKPAEMDRIHEIALRYKLKVVEDAAQAHGALYRGKPCGTMSEAACFSFYPSKNLGAFGDGGAVITNDPEIAKKVRMSRDHGRQGKYLHSETGFGERLDGLQAAVLRVKLRHLDSWNRTRRSHADRYQRLLLRCRVVLPDEGRDLAAVYHLFVVRSRERDALQEHMHRRDVATGIHYPVPLHMQPAFANLGYRKGDFPEAEKAAERVLSLPMYPELRDSQLVIVAKAVAEFEGSRT